MLYLVNTHTHTKYTGHGSGEVEEYVHEALKAGIRLLGFSEHYPLSDAFDSGRMESMAPDSVASYLLDIEIARQKYPSLEILSGAEIDWLGELEDREFNASELLFFDYLYGSVHYLHGEAFDNPEHPEMWCEGERADEIWEDYYQVWCEATTSSMPFTIMAHPDLVKKFGYYPSFTINPLYEMAVDALMTSSRMIEINTSGWYYGCKEAFPSPELLSLCARAQIPCTVGTDAHKPELVSRDIERAYAYLYEAGYRKITVPTRRGDRRTISL